MTRWVDGLSDADKLELLKLQAKVNLWGESARAGLWGMATGIAVILLILVFGELVFR